MTKTAPDKKEQPLLEAKTPSEIIERALKRAAEQRK